jgi:hypothetical protein
MELRRADVAGLAGTGDQLTALDLVAALDQELLGVGVGGDVPVGMTNLDEISRAPNWPRALDLGQTSGDRQAPISL